MAVALDDLGAHWVRLQRQVGEDLRLEIRVELAVRAHRTGDLPGRGVVEGPGEACAVAGNLERPARQLEPERGGFGVDGVGPAHHHGAGLGPGPGDERREERVGGTQEEVARGAELQRKPRVGHVAAREPQVEEATLRPDGLRDLAHERDHVVLRGSLDLRDPVDVDAGTLGDRRVRVTRQQSPPGLRPCNGQLDPEHGCEAGAPADGLERLRRDEAAAHLGLRDGKLHAEHGGEAGLVGPGRAHLRTRVARDHRPAARGRLSSVTVCVRSGPTETSVIGTPAREASAAT